MADKAQVKNEYTKLPIKSYLLYVCIALFLTTGVTFSKYITKTEGGDQATAAKFGQLQVSESDVNEANPIKEFELLPGATITKDPKVSMSSSEVAVCVTVDITLGDGWTPDADYRKFTYGQVINTEDSSNPKDEAFLSWSVDENWTFKEQKENTYTYYKNLPANTRMDHVSVIAENNIYVSKWITYEDYYKIVENAEGIVEILDMDIQARVEQID